VDHTAGSALADAGFLGNHTETWGRVVAAFSQSAQKPYPDKESAPLFAATTFQPVIRWNNDSGGVYKGFRNRANAELSGLVVIDGGAAILQLP
jgi:hypothetical protein